MGGIFSKANRPKLPGAYFNFVPTPVTPVPSSPGTTVAIPFTHDWGPTEEIVHCDSFQDFQAVFGSSDDTPGYLAVLQAFLGENVDGRLGAGSVTAYRMVGSAGAKAAHTLVNTAGSPANALVLTARYDGTRGNDLRLTTQDHVADSAKNELIVLDGSTVLETYVYDDTDIAGLAATINATSDWITASELVTGTSLAAVSGVALTTGNDGTTLIAGDWTAMMTALATEAFGVFVPFDLTDSGILASLKTWATAQNNAGYDFEVVVGGGTDESEATAATRSGTLASPLFLNVGVGHVTDTSNGPGGTEIDLSPSQLAPRIAGVLAARGEYLSITGARLQGVDLPVGATPDQQVSAFDDGVVVLARDSALVPTHIAVGLTTWRASDAASDPSRPYLTYRQPKYVRTMQGLALDLTAYARDEVLGLRPITKATRDAVVAETKRLLDQREQSGVLESGWTVGIDQDPPPTDEDEFIALAISLKFGRALEQIYFSISVA